MPGNQDEGQCRPQQAKPFQPQSSSLGGLQCPIQAVVRKPGSLALAQPPGQPDAREGDTSHWYGRCSPSCPIKGVVLNEMGLGHRGGSDPRRPQQRKWPYMQLNPPPHPTVRHRDSHPKARHSPGQALPPFTQTSPACQQWATGCISGIDASLLHIRHSADNWRHHAAALCHWQAEEGQRRTEMRGSVRAVHGMKAWACLAALTAAHHASYHFLAASSTQHKPHCSRGHHLGPWGRVHNTSLPCTAPAPFLPLPQPAPGPIQTQPAATFQPAGKR